MKKYFAVLTVFIFCSSILKATQTDDPYSLLNDFGTVGLIDIPSARMQPDASFWAMFSMQDVMDTYSLSFQALPFLETSFRYHIHSPREGRLFFFDRSYGVKLRLLKERKYIPNLAIGFQDVVGTGVNSAEYLVASKKINCFDLTLGMGWGRFADRDSFNNPLRNVSDSFKTRNATVGLGGKFRPEDWFSGKDVGLFGGIQYEIINDKLYGVLEYNSDEYRYESVRNTVEIKSPYSFGIVWKFIQNTQLGVSWQHGSELGFKISSLFDTKNLQKKSPKNLNYSKNLPQQGLPPKSKFDWYNNMFEDAIKSGILLRKSSFTGKNTVNIEYSNFIYIVENDALERLIFFAELHLPNHITRVNFISNQNYLNTFTGTYTRHPKSILHFREDKKEYLQRISYQAPKKLKDTYIETQFNLPKTVINYGLDLRYRLFDPDNPFNKQLFLKINPNIYITEGIEINTSIRMNIYNDFDTIIRGSSPTSVNQVRSDFQKYLKESPNGISSLVLQTFHKASDDLYLKTSSGILEEMYMGSGIEILYKPFNWDIGLGGNLFYAKKRAYEQWLKTQDYETVTGFLSLFWASPFYNVDLGFHYGRYLAKDKGFTFEISRHFDSGWELGLFATKTNVSAEDFGEGSFDKGFIIRIPFQSIVNKASANTYYTLLRPIQRDGGARLEGYSSSLWQTLRRNQKATLERTKSRTYE